MIIIIKLKLHSRLIPTESEKRVFTRLLAYVCISPEGSEKAPPYDQKWEAWRYMIHYMSPIRLTGSNPGGLSHRSKSAVTIVCLVSTAVDLDSSAVE